jgi:hypothetical protein
MGVDTHGLAPAHVGRRLRIELAGGEVDEIEMLELTVCEQPEPCCGITYRLLATNRNDVKKTSEVYWTRFEDIREFQVLGD